MSRIRIFLFAFLGACAGTVGVSAQATSLPTHVTQTQNTKPAVAYVYVTSSVPPSGMETNAYALPEGSAHGGCGLSFSHDRFLHGSNGSLVVLHGRDKHLLGFHRCERRPDAA